MASVDMTTPFRSKHNVYHGILLALQYNDVDDLCDSNTDDLCDSNTEDLCYSNTDDLLRARLKAALPCPCLAALPNHSAAC